MSIITTNWFNPKSNHIQGAHKVIYDLKENVHIKLFEWHFKEKNGKKSNEVFRMENKNINELDRNH